MPDDKRRVMNLIRLNTPEYFAPEEEADLSEYLDRWRELYYVLETGGEIVGCGGINFADHHTTGKISWDIIHPPGRENPWALVCFNSGSKNSNPSPASGELQSGLRRRLTVFIRSGVSY